MQWIKTAILALLVCSAAVYANPEKTEQLININTASVEQLSALKGIGASKAQAIVAYREHHGKFATTDDLTKVKGIGSATLQSNRAQLTVE